MIATLRGTISEKLSDIVVLDVRGVGYGLLMTAQDQGRLHTGDETKLYVYEHIRENMHDLYGFCDSRTKEFFELLLGVNGVGPRMALNVLSIATLSEVQSAIASADVKFVQAAQGVGKRVAERIVVDLKDKVGLAGSDISELLKSSGMTEKDEAVQAMVALGFSQPDAVQALVGVDSKLPTEERVKQALKGSAL